MIIDCLIAVLSCNKILQKGRMVILFLLLISQLANAQINNPRQDLSLLTGWETIFIQQDSSNYSQLQQLKSRHWKSVQIPHNWDGYEGYQRKLHGNLHGSAWYKKNIFIKAQTNKKHFLFFEGVGSYASIWLNGKLIGKHAGGRTSFTIDISETAKFNQDNILEVLAEHPAGIKDLPWVCGGCSDERGFSEGSQPLGIFRPVHLIVTNPVRIEPFGVHAWNDTLVSSASANIQLSTNLKNYAAVPRQLLLKNYLLDASGKTIAQAENLVKIEPGKNLEIAQQFSNLKNVQLWSLENPYLYQIKTVLVENGLIADAITTDYGIRWISWPIGKPKSSNQFFLNGKPVFINGIAEYEHQLGQSHAFTKATIAARAKWIKSSGFNAFRDGHQPHNLSYQDFWDQEGLLWWTQFSAHVWYNTPAFREQFKTLLKEWVIERRNSPSLVLWGLQNESKLPADFAKECTELIRSLDPTCSAQRLVTTCNGGTGTDWDVPQNWTGTYGGDPLTYADDIKKQILIGEYGAWRSLDLHTEGGFKQNGLLSEDRMVSLMETKIRLAEQARDSSCGQFFWLLTSHDNPGRVQGGEGFRDLDRIGPVNYKGLLTPWEEPTDAYYMFRSNYANQEKDPMVYLVSHTWPSRFTKPGIKDGIIVYSNCDEVELFNGDLQHSLGRKQRGGKGTHFQWDQVNIAYNQLLAVGYVHKKAVAKDQILLHHLPAIDANATSSKKEADLVKAQPGYQYLYRLNCGGPDYQDSFGNWWKADNKTNGTQMGSRSWTDDFPGMPAMFASQRNANMPIDGTAAWPLFQQFRYGREALQFFFPVPDGNYLVELYFVEPWLGVGSSMDCKGMRQFDVAINGQTVLKNLDIWKEVGAFKALKKSIKATIRGGKLVVSFPQIQSGQAIIAAIAIASEKTIPPFNIKTGIASGLIQEQTPNQLPWHTWLDLGNQQYADAPTQFSALPSSLFGADWLQWGKDDNQQKTTIATLKMAKDADLYIGLDSGITKPEWMQGFQDIHEWVENDAGQKFQLFYKTLAAGELVALGSNPGKENYLVVLKPKTLIEPAYDLKIIQSSKAVNGKYNASLVTATVNEKQALLVKENEGVVEMEFETGVGDMYSLTFKYANTRGRVAQLEMQLLMADGKLLKKELLTFTASQIGKWNYYNTNTGTMINAGKYRIKLLAKDAVGIAISGVDIQ
jgi:hypothetical protein